MDNNSKDKKEYAGNNKDNSDGITDIQIDTSFEQVAYNPEAIKALRESLDSISRAYQPVVDSMKQTTTLMANILSQAVKVDYDRLFGNIRKSLQVLTDAISRINIPHISEERKKELVESHKEWGHHGWTPIPVVEAETLFDSFPLSKKDADDK